MDIKEDLTEVVYILKIYNWTFKLGQNFENHQNWRKNLTVWESLHNNVHTTPPPPPTMQSLYFIPKQLFYTLVLPTSLLNISYKFSIGISNNRHKWFRSILMNCKGFTNVWNNKSKKIGQVIWELLKTIFKEIDTLTVT